MFAPLRIFARAGVVVGALLLVHPCSAQSPGYTSDTRAYNIAHGRVVFTSRCLECHESGRRGAPMLDDAEDWKDRLEQPLSTLIAHAIEGHGRMPPRGDQALSTQDISAAVAYVVDRTRRVVASSPFTSIEDINDLPPTAAGPATGRETETPDQAVVQMFLMLFGKDRWK